MSVEDVEEVLEIEASWSARPWSRRTFENELGIPFSRSGVAIRAHRPDHVLAYFVRWVVGDEVRLLSLAVRESARREGLGGWLLDEVLDEAKALGCLRAVLEVAEANLAARALYGSRGFREVTRREDYYGPGKAALILERSVGRAAS